MSQVEFQNVRTGQKFSFVVGARAAAIFLKMTPVVAPNNHDDVLANAVNLISGDTTVVDDFRVVEIQ